jgi:hypothetical protein
MSITTRLWNKEELESLGYNLKIVRKFTYKNNKPYFNTGIGHRSK